MTELRKFNHTSVDYGVWVEYNGERFKDLYSIETLDGVVFQAAIPNGSGWYIQPELDMTAEEFVNAYNEGKKWRMKAENNRLLKELNVLD